LTKRDVSIERYLTQEKKDQSEVAMTKIKEGRIKEISLTNERVNERIMTLNLMRSVIL